MNFIQVCGYATTTDVGGVLKVYFPFSPVPGDYKVLDTDYENYACVWSCVSDLVGLFHTEIGYILTREQEYNPEYVSTIMISSTMSNFRLILDIQCVEEVYN